MNVSATGAAVRLPRSIPVGTDQTLTIGSDSGPVELVVRVVRITPPTAESLDWLVGVAFLGLPAETRKTIARFISPVR